MPEEMLKRISLLFPEKITFSRTEVGKIKERIGEGFCECESDCRWCPNAEVCLEFTDNRTDIEYQMDIIALDMSWWETVLMENKLDKKSPDTIADAIVNLIACQMQLDNLEQKRQMAS